MGCFCTQSRHYATFVHPNVALQESMESHLQGAASAHSLAITPRPCMGVWTRTCQGVFLHTVLHLRHSRAPQGGSTGEYGIAPAMGCFCTQSHNYATFVLPKLASPNQTPAAGASCKKCMVFSSCQSVANQLRFQLPIQLLLVFLYLPIKLMELKGITPISF